MNAAYYIAKRYFFSKRKKSLVHVISLISLIGIATGTMALVIVLSVYNGLGKVIEELSNVFSPSLLIEAKEGKSFHLADFPTEEIEKIKGVLYFCPTVEENVWVRYKQKESIAFIKGVGESYQEMTQLEKNLLEGSYLLKDDYGYHAILGGELFYKLSINLRNISNIIQVYIPKREKNISLQLSENFNSGPLIPSAYFATQPNIDEKYILTHIDFVRELLNYAEDEVTSVEIGLEKEAKVGPIQKKIKALIGEGYLVKNRHEQQELYYKVYNSEKVAIYGILLFIILIAGFNLIGSIYLLIIDKRKDIHILNSMGMPFPSIRKIFFFEGMLISSIGIALGALAGTILSGVQQLFGIIKMGQGNFVTDAFPVAINGWDILLILTLVLIICTSCVLFCVCKMKNKERVSS